MAIDYGTVRVGVAVSDPLGVIAQGVETIRVRRHEPEKTLERILELIDAYEVGTVVVGLPRRTDNRPSESETNARQLAGELAARVQIPVVMRDERYTSVIANRILRDSAVKSDRRRDVVDQVAAEVILKDYLEQLRRETREN